MGRFFRVGALPGLVAFLAAGGPAPGLELDQSGFDTGSEGNIAVMASEESVALRWPMDAGSPAIARIGVLEVSLRGDGAPLVEMLGVAPGGEAFAAPVFRDLDPAFVLTVGERTLKESKGWTIFFDKVHTRPYQAYALELDLNSARIEGHGMRATLFLSRAVAGPFEGELAFTVYAGSSLVHVEAIMATKLPAAALLYDAGLTGEGLKREGTKIGWLDNADVWGEIDVEPAVPVATPPVRYRSLVATATGGSVAVFAPPHQYFYPLDFADNFGFTWIGSGYRGMVEGFGFGIRQPPGGDGRFVPWVNAPPESSQRMSMFWLLSEAGVRETLGQVAAFTREDRFADLPGHRKFTSHYHVEHTLNYLELQVQSGVAGIPEGLKDPGFVRAFKRAGVEIVHLAEFHRGDTPKLEAGERLAQLALMHGECERLSGEDFLLLPGEEPNVHLGGHWISFFPKPVNWVLHRDGGAPFVEESSEYGRVYHVGSPEDVLKLMETEGGLMWTAHPRINGSTGFPDGYREKAFYKSDRFLGAAWKAMPADLSMERLGTRVLDLMDDMANWGTPKYVPGEVDVFKVEPDYELYGHMNINYLRLSEIPRFEEGWQQVLDSLRAGAFFVTTGEVLLPKFTVNGAQSGERVALKGGGAEIEAEIEWTFPLRRALIVSGDGAGVDREEINLSETAAFAGGSYRWRRDLAGRKWVRLEVWDVAGNGAFTQPVWLD